MTIRTPESGALDAILGVLELLPGCLAWRAQAGTLRFHGRTVRLGPTGCPDVLVVLAPHGRLLALEVKRAGAKGRDVRASQVAFMARLAELGAATAVVRDAGEALSAVRAARGAPP